MILISASGTSSVHMASQSSASTTSSSGVDGGGGGPAAAAAAAAKSETVSNVGSMPVVGNFGAGSSDPSGGISSIAKEVYSKKAQSKSFWRQFQKRP